MSATLQRIIKITAEQLGVPEADVKADTKFVTDLGADSLDSIELVMALEDEFAVEVPDDEAEQIDTPAAALAWLVKFHPDKVEA